MLARVVAATAFVAVVPTAPVEFDGGLVLGTCLVLAITLAAAGLFLAAVRCDLEAPARDGRLAAWECGQDTAAAASTAPAALARPGGGAVDGGAAPSTAPASRHGLATTENRLGKAGGAVSPSS